ncbi:MAG: hypothetical protein AB7U29_04210 [Desulfobulbus sp.]
MGSPVNQSGFVDIPFEYYPSVEELPGELPLIASAVEEHLPGQGVRVALILAQKYPGTPIYLHNVNKIVNKYTFSVMREEYDRGGITVKELSRKYGLPMTKTKEILASVEKRGSESSQKT